MDFRYERLPIFCYWCGKLDYDDKDCSLWIDSNESLELEERQYGPWLRVDTEKFQRPQLAEVLSCKKGGEGLHKGSDHQSKNQSKNNKWKATGAEHQSVDDDNPITPRSNTLIQAVDTVKERMGIQESMKENRADTGPFYIDQTEVQGTGGKLEKANKAQLPCTGPLTVSDGPVGCVRNQQEAQKFHNNMDQRSTEEGRVLRSKASEALHKDLIQATEPKIESLSQKTNSPKKLLKKKKSLENRGKENEPPSRAKTTQAWEV